MGKFDHNHHQQRSLRMAPFNKGGVVDSYGNVHGVRNLILQMHRLFPLRLMVIHLHHPTLIDYTIAKQLMWEDSEDN
ncbi:hypothetical protein ABFY60_12395 [Lysinibacillus pakistanensis]